MIKTALIGAALAAALTACTSAPARLGSDPSIPQMPSSSPSSESSSVIDTPSQEVIIRKEEHGKVVRPKVISTTPKSTPKSTPDPTPTIIFIPPASGSNTATPSMPPRPTGEFNTETIESCEAKGMVLAEDYTCVDPHYWDGQ